MDQGHQRDLQDKITISNHSDADHKIAYVYHVLDAQYLTNIDEKGTGLTIRAVCMIDPSEKIRLTMLYPAPVGRDISEVLRVIDSLQTGEKKWVTTPINWQMGEEIIVLHKMSTGDAKKTFKDVWGRATSVGSTWST